MTEIIPAVSDAETTRLTDRHESSEMTHAGKLDPQQREAIRFMIKTRLKSGLYVFLADPFVEIFPPVIYIKAGIDIIVIALVVSWILTLIFRQDTLVDNAVIKYLGYNNLCVGWDALPSLLIGGTMWSMTSFFSLRFCYFNILRLKRFNELPTANTFRNYYFPLYTTYFSIFSTLVFSQTFMVRPEEGILVWLHTLPFLCAMYGTFFMVLALFLEHPNGKGITRMSWFWLSIYGFTSVVNPIIFLYDFFYFDFINPGHRSPFPYQILKAMDMTWFFCLFLNGNFFPSSILVKRTFEALDPDDINKFIGDDDEAKIERGHLHIIDKETCPADCEGLPLLSRDAILASDRNIQV